jgi:type IV secretion system protein VirD4
MPTLSPRSAPPIRAAILVGLLVLPVVAIGSSDRGLLFLLFFVAFILVRRWLNRPTVSANFGTAKLATRFNLKDAGYLKGHGLLLGRALPERPPLLRSLVDLFRAPWAESESVVRHFAAAVLGPFCSGRPLVHVPRHVHLLTVAPAGAGKGVSLILPNLLTYRGSVFVTDPKGENYLKSAATRRRFGKVFRVDPFQVCGQGTDGFNPLDLLAGSSDRLINDAAAIAQALVVRNPQEHDQHFQDNAEVCITAFILYVATAKAPSEEKNLLTVRRLIADSLAFRGAVADMARSKVAGGALRALAQQMSGWIDRELSSIVSTANRHLAFVDSPVVSRCLAFSSFDPADFVRRPASVYVCLPPDQLEPLARLMRLWLTTFLKRLAQLPPQEENTVLFLLDEAAALGRLPALEQAITLMRGYGVRIWLICQALSQLQKMFPEEKSHQTVQANMGHQVFFGIRDLETARQVSDWIGQATVHNVSQQQSSGFSYTPMFATLLGQQPSTSVSQGSSVTIAETGVQLIRPEEILQMPARTAIVLAAGLDPLLTAMVRYYDDPAFAEARAEQEAAVADPEPEQLPASQITTAAGGQVVRCLKCKDRLVLYPGQPGACPTCGVKMTLQRRSTPRVNHAARSRKSSS